MKKKIVKYLSKFDFKDVEGKTIIITGGNAGIGFTSAKYACYLKMKVIIACRNENKGNAAIKEIKEEFPDADIKLMLLDMSEEQSIKDFVNKIFEEKIDIDVFYHNAGVYRLPYQLKENKELIASTNYFGPYILTSLLLPYLKSLNHEIKMVITSSIASKWASNKVDMLTPTEKVSRTTRYANSKLLDAYLFKYLFDNDKGNVKYYLTHPGVTGTNLFTNAYKSKFFVKIVNFFMKVFANKLWKSSLSITRVLASNSVEGTFYGPTHIFGAKGYPKENKFLNKKYKFTNEIINKSEQITGYQLIKN